MIEVKTNEEALPTAQQKNTETFFLALEKANVALEDIFARHPNLSASEKTMIIQLVSCFFEAKSQSLFLQPNVLDNEDMEAQRQSEIFEQELGAYFADQVHSSVLEHIASLSNRVAEEYLLMSSLIADMRLSVQGHYIAQKKKHG